MNRRSEQRETVIEALQDHVLKAGLAQTSLRQLAEAAGISDRMLLYYFKNKTDVLSAVLERLAANLTLGLEAAIPAGAHLGPADLFVKTAQLTRSPDMQPFMRVWIEVIAAAARDEEPYKSIASAIVAGFLAWIEDRLSPDISADPKADAAMLLTMVDGLALLAVCADDEQVEAAIQAMQRTLNS